MIPKRLVETVLNRDGFACVIALPGCAKVASCCDHRANRGSGGSKILDDARALIAACGGCNGAKADATGSTRLDLIERGVIVAKSATNQGTLVRCTYTPVVYPDGQVWFLTSDGRRVDEQSVPF